MSAVPSLGVVVNTFNQPDYLVRVLESLRRQSLLPAEVFVADDGSGPETRQAFDAWACRQPFRCEHVWQEKVGFRRSRILNRTVAHARSEYIVFLDGDSV